MMMICVFTPAYHISVQDSLHFDKPAGNAALIANNNVLIAYNDVLIANNNRAYEYLKIAYHYTHFFFIIKC